jgi:hypothetical protein
MKRAKESAAFNSLYRHNKDVVSVEARATHIARAFLKGKPFRSVENILYTSYYRNNVYIGGKFDDQQKAIKRAKTIMNNYHLGSKVDKETWETWLTM